MVKHGIAWGAMTGVTSAELAARGFTGIPSLLGKDKYRDWTTDIGENYLMVDGVRWKMKEYACCGWAHAGVEGARELVLAHRIELDDIEQIIVEAFHETARLGTRLPATTEAAQFNLAWPVAAMLVDGEIGPNQMLERRLSDPQIQNLARRIEIIESEELNELCRLHAKGDPRGRFASIVTIKLKDGREYNSGMKDGGMSYSEPPWTRDMMVDKFRWVAGHVLEAKQIDELLDMAWHFEEIEKVSELTSRLMYR
jgi:2-methylcitrate dehydratase PrpD